MTEFLTKVYWLAAGTLGIVAGVLCVKEGIELIKNG